MCHSHGQCLILSKQQLCLCQFVAYLRSTLCKSNQHLKNQRLPRLFKIYKYLSSEVSFSSIMDMSSGSVTQIFGLRRVQSIEGLLY